MVSGVYTHTVVYGKAMKGFECVVWSSIALRRGENEKWEKHWVGSMIDGIDGFS